MQIKFPLLSIASLAFLLFFGLQGDVELYSWEVGVAISPDEVKVMVDPVWVVWTDVGFLHYKGHTGLCIGNVAAIPIEFRDTQLGDYVLVHETNHAKQFYALGMSVLIAQFFIDIEPPKDVIIDLNDPSQCDRVMWLPPDWWVDQWHFVAIVYDKSP